MICGNCDKTDGIVYTSNPPQVKCIYTGKFHFMEDECDVIADLVEVVRCKDCKYWRYNDCQNDSHGYCPISENDFCSQGEKRERE